MEKIGVIDVGGGLRGIYAAGVFDWCMDNGVQFDYGIGISAGSANLASYLSSQRGRNYLFYEEYSMRKEYMGAGNMLHGGSFLNLQYIYGTLSNRECENPLDFERMAANPMEWYMIATDATTGKPKYFTRGDMRQDDYRVLMASCCIPVACKPIEIGGVPYYDGALGDTIPLQKAFADGCDKVVLILTKPVGTIRADGAHRLCQNQHNLVAAVRKSLLQRDRITQRTVIIRHAANLNRLARHRDAAGCHQHAVVVLAHIAACKVLRLASCGVCGDHVPLHRISRHPFKIQRVFTFAVTQCAVDILQVQKRPAVQHISCAHIFFAHGVFLIEQIVPPALAA